MNVKSDRWLRARDLTITLSSSDVIIVRSNNQDCLVPFHGLRILDFFSQPHTFDEALATLSEAAVGIQECIDLTKSILVLIRANALQLVDDTSRAVAPLDADGFGAASIHIAMLNDHRRTASYLDAIRRSVKAGEIVADIGTGTGVLAVAAVQAGAQHVYAIEPTAIGRLAEAVFRANNVESRITLVPGWSTHVELPQRADVIVSEIIGNDPFGERALEAIIDARKRLGSPSVRLLPENMTVFARPVMLPEALVRKHRFEPAATQEWRRRYGIDFGPLADARVDRPVGIHVNPVDVRQWLALAASRPIVEIDFSKIDSTAILEKIDCEIEADGILNGIVIYFTIGLSDGVTLTTTPEMVDDDNHWSVIAWLLPEPLQATRGQRIEIQYAHNSAGAPNGATARVIDRNARA